MRDKRHTVIMGIIVVGMVLSVIGVMLYSNSKPIRNTNKYNKTTTMTTIEDESKVTTTTTIKSIPIEINSDSTEDKQTTTKKSSAATTTTTKDNTSKTENIESVIATTTINTPTNTTTTTINIPIETTNIPTETTIETTTTQAVETTNINNYYSDNDVVLLAMLINHESSASWEGKVYVGSVVVNRMKYFDTSVSEVIYMPGQFTYDLSYYSDEDYQAAQYVLTNGAVDNRVFYFTGCHPDGLNWFEDVNHNYIIAA